MTKQWKTHLLVDITREPQLRKGVVSLQIHQLVRLQQLQLETVVEKHVLLPVLNRVRAFCRPVKGVHVLDALISQQLLQQLRSKTSGRASEKHSGCPGASADLRTSVRPNEHFSIISSKVVVAEAGAGFVARDKLCNMRCELFNDGMREDDVLRDLLKQSCAHL